MSNVASILKEEIARVARKEVRAEVQALKKSSASYRRDIAALKKRMQALERQVNTQKRAAPRAAPQTSHEEQSDRQLRFSASRLAAQRKKLGLSAASFAALIGVAPITVYKWEGGQNRPRRAQLQAIAAVRSLGKKAALARLQELQQA